MISSFLNRSARSMKSSRCMCPNLWIFSRRCFGRTKLSSVIRIFASNTGGEASSPLPLGSPADTPPRVPTHAGQAQVGDPLAGKAVVLLLELEAPVQDHVADRRDRVRRRERRDDVLARQLDLVAGLDAVELADHPAAVEPLPQQQHAAH